MKIRTEERDHAKYFRNIVAVIFLFITILTIAQVGFRFVLNKPLVWSEELVRFLLIWMTMLGAAVISYDDRHLSVQSLVDVLPSTPKFILYTLRQIAIVAFSAILIATSTEMIKISHLDASGALHIPFSFWRVAPCVGAFFIIIFTVIRYFKDLKSFKEGKYGKTKEDIQL